MELLVELLVLELGLVAEDELVDVLVELLVLELVP